MSCQPNSENSGILRITFNFRKLSLWYFFLKPLKFLKNITSCVEITCCGFNLLHAINREPLYSLAYSTHLLCSMQCNRITMNVGQLNYLYGFLAYAKRLWGNWLDSCWLFASSRQSLAAQTQLRANIATAASIEMRQNPTN